MSAQKIQTPGYHQKKKKKTEYYLSPPWFEALIVQCVARPYTDCTNLSP